MICNPWPSARVSPLLRSFGVALLLTSGGCASVTKAPPAAQAPEAATEVELLPALVDARIADPTERPADPEADYYYQVLLGELAAARGDNARAARAFAEAVRLRPDPEIAQRGARLALAADDFDTAYELARKWQETGDSSEQATELLLRLAVETGDAAGARTYARRLLDQYSGPEPAYRALARSLSGTEDGSATAIAVMQDLATSAGEESAEAHYSLSLLALHFEDYTAARAAAERAVALSPPGEARDQYALMLVGALLQASDTEGAMAAAQQTLPEAHDPAAQHRDLAALFEQAEAFAEARHFLEALLERRPNDYDALLSLGRVALQEERPEAAEAALRRVWESGSDQAADAAYLLGRTAEMQDDTQAAMEWYARAEDSGDNLRAALRMAQIEAERGSLESARERLSQARERNPALAPRLLRVESELLYQQHRYEEAAKLLRSGVAAYPRDTAMRYAYAVALEQSGDVEQARTQLRYILTLHPDHTESLNALGYSLVVANEQLDEAEELLSRALSQSPDDPAIIDSMGWLRYRQGRLEEALELLERAYSAFPDAEIGAHLGEVLWIMGERERARQIWQRHLDEQPDHPVLTETVERLVP